MFTHTYFISSGGRLCLRLRNNRRKAEINLVFKATQDELDEALHLVTSRGRGNSRLKPHIKFYEIKLRQIEDALAEEGRKDEDVKVIKTIVERELGLVKEDSDKKSENKGCFVAHYKKFMGLKTNLGTRGVYKHTLDRIRLFDPDIDNKNFEDINLQWLTNFETFCAKTACKNARNIHLRNIRAVFNNAIDYEITTVYPFRRFKIRAEETRKRDLPVEELRKVFDYPVEPYAEIYRDMFKLSFMLIGINCVDMHRLREIINGRIEYKRAKTGRLYSIKVEPEALEIIKKYEGKNGLLCIADRWSDHRNFRHQCDKALQLIGATRTGRGGKKGKGLWPMLTTYWARHSWATIAYSLGISKDVIAQALGHADESHSTTNIYIHEDMRNVDRANRIVLDWVLYGKR